jgi:hypothetical protein
MGGLGNQLFQYAAARSLADRHKTDLKLDLSFLNTDSNEHTKRDLALNVFNTNYSICSDHERADFYDPPLINKFFPFMFQKKVIANEKAFHFDPMFFNLPKNTFLNGFWQTEKYFIGIRKILLEELVINLQMSEKIKAVSDRILNSNSVSLHVRRGDYVSNKNSKSYHGNLELDYFYEAIKQLKGVLNDLNFFVFSDEIDWVRSNLKINDPVEYIDFNTNENAAFDMYLMSLCQHNIIANSSFSWWAAWLNKNTDKKVIAPKKWFFNESINTKDLIPNTWLKI